MLYVLCRKRRDGRRPPFFWVYLAASAILFGLTVASKYMYGVIGVAILADWFIPNAETSQPFTFARIRAIVFWGLLAVIVFFLTDPYLWPDPVNRLQSSLFYHTAYSSSAAEVEQANFPFWQQFVWLSMSVPWNQESFTFFLDPFILVLAFLGFWRLRTEKRVYLLWLGFGLLFLLVWRTKWPQYLLMITAPLSLAAAEGVVTLIVNPLKGWWARRGEKVPAEAAARPGDLRRALPWLVPGLVAFAALTLFPLLFQIAISMTSLSGQTLRDGLQGGLWREIWGGLTGQIQVSADILEAEPNKVHFIGLLDYGNVWNELSSMGTPFFSVFWAALSVVSQGTLGFGAALLLWNPRVRWRRGWQILFILPWAIPEAIGALMWMNIFAPFSGWLTLAVKDLGPNVPFAGLVGWESHPDQTLLALLISSLWYGFPFLMLAASAALKMLPAEVYAAAAIDGANAWQTLRYITWPLVWPLIVPALIIRAIFSFNQFYLFQMFLPYYQNLGNSTLSSLSYYVLYNQTGFSSSAIINIIAMLMLVGFVFLFNRWNKEA